MANQINNIIYKIKEQALGWTVLGLGVFIFYPVIFFNWDLLKESHLLLPFGVILIFGSVIWWLWTMTIIFQLIKLREEELISFKEILSELKSIKKELRKDFEKNNLH